ncbi:MAG: AAA family ATPase [Lachnoclostridium sp.]|nr:AAA family ATPase [Lachnoclostridium sp.]
MKEKSLPFSLSQILITLTDHDFRPTPSQIRKLIFDDCHDFRISQPNHYLAVQATFTNERLIRKNRHTGIRRKVTISLKDQSGDETSISSQVTVNIKHDDLTADVVTSLPVDDEMLSYDHTYSIEVSDCKSGVILGKTEIHFFVDEDDDLFERLLDEFISSQLEEEEEETTEPKEITSQEEPYISPLKLLENLTGLASVKEKITAYEKLMMFNKLRNDHHLNTSAMPLHAIFCGSPGTGKTTVAKRMGLMLKRIGILSKGHIITRERATLLGPNYSNEETNTLAAIEEAQGGILFIDEAYQLYQPNDPRDPGKFVIEALMTALADESRRDWMLILAGYTDEMMQMLNMNPGLKSRIPASNIYTFDDFTDIQLMEIAVKHLHRNDFNLTSEAAMSLRRRILNDYNHRDRTFGNARHIINLIQTEILPAMANRVISSGEINTSTLSTILPADIPQHKSTVTPTRNPIGFRKS